MVGAIKGDIVKRFAMRGKFVVIVRIDTADTSKFAFRVTDKCNQKDYYSNDQYDKPLACAVAAMKICNAV